VSYLLASGEQMHIREVISDDAPVLLALFQQVARESAFLLVSPSEADRTTVEEMKERIETYTDNKNSLFIVAVTEKELVGGLTLMQYEWQKQEHIASLDIAVKSSHWNLGIARRLMNDVMQWLETQTVIKCIQLEVMANNEKGIRLFRNFGFHEEGRQARAIYLDHGMYEDVVLMGKWIGG